jgi:hypothetical protein
VKPKKMGDAFAFVFATEKRSQEKAPTSTLVYEAQCCHYPHSPLDVHLRVVAVDVGKASPVLPMFCFKPSSANNYIGPTIDCDQPCVIYQATHINVPVVQGSPIVIGCCRQVHGTVKHRDCCTRHPTQFNTRRVKPLTPYEIAKQHHT